MGMPTITNGKEDAPSTATIKYNGASTQPGITDAERIARKRRELGTTLPPPDSTDAMLIKSAAGVVQQYRKQGRKSTFLTSLGDPFGGTP